MTELAMYDPQSEELVAINLDQFACISSFGERKHISTLRLIGTELVSSKLFSDPTKTIDAMLDTYKNAKTMGELKYSPRFVVVGEIQCQEFPTGFLRKSQFRLEAIASMYSEIQ